MPGEGLTWNFVYDSRCLSFDGTPPECQTLLGRCSAGKRVFHICQGRDWLTTLAFVLVEGHGECKKSVLVKKFARNEVRRMKNPTKRMCHRSYEFAEISEMRTGRLSLLLRTRDTITASRLVLKSSTPVGSSCTTVEQPSRA